MKHFGQSEAYLAKKSPKTRDESPQKKAQPLRLSFLCGRRESNPYASRHQILSLACLPISTRPRFGTANVRQFIGFANFCPAISPLPSQSIYISQNWIYLHWYNEYIPLLTSYPLIPGNMFHVYLYFQSQARPIL